MEVFVQKCCRVQLQNVLCHCCDSAFFSLKVSFRLRLANGKRKWSYDCRNKWTFMSVLYRLDPIWDHKRGMRKKKETNNCADKIYRNLHIKVLRLFTFHCVHYWIYRNSDKLSKVLLVELLDWPPLWLLESAISLTKNKMKPHPDSIWAAPSFVRLLISANFDITFYAYRLYCFLWSTAF